MAHAKPPAPLTREDLLEVLEHRDRLTKNGETWRGYFRRLTTPTNIFVIAGFLYMAGAEIRQVRVDLATALESTRVSRDVEDALAADIRDMQAAMDRLSRQPSVDPDTLTALRAELAALRERLEQAPTRREVTEQWQAALARLDRIEAQHKTFMAGRGAGS